ncbi:hypothetical protein BH18ACI5_BH18ACI5_13430 [soil metagenome]
MRTALTALSALFLAAHLVYLPPTLEDIDSINFAMGVRDFDVSRHQPHPPGYPVFIALGKVSTPVLTSIGLPGAEPRALALWSAAFGALLFPLCYLLFRAIDGDSWRAFWAAAFAGCSPLVWSTAARPLSDVTGLAFAVAAQALLVATVMGRAGGIALTVGAFLAGVASGVRVQTAMLTGPILLFAFATTRGLSMMDRVRTVMAFLLGIAIWAVPLIAASGGMDSYIVSLGAQAGEDFGGVQMLWTSRSARLLLTALLDSFVLPWGSLVLGAAVLIVALAGVLRLLGARALSTIGLLLLLFAPYAAFHLHFHETGTMRYALPLVVPVAYLSVRAVNTGTRMVLVEMAFITAFLLISVPAMTALGRNGSPAVAAVRDALATGSTTSAHAGMRRVWEWEAQGSATRFLSASHGHEWLGLVEEWRRNPAARIQFLANPRRTDLALIDPRAAREERSYQWSVPEIPFVAGARPGPVNRIAFDPPGWMLDRGWALTAEVAGVTERDGYGPHLKPSVAWVRPRETATSLMIGGRHLGAPGDPETTTTLSTGGRQPDAWRVAPGFFFRLLPLPAGTLAGTGYLPLSVTATPTDARPAAVKLEQFDLQPERVPMLGVFEGWQEPEYSALTGKAWRWMSERATLWVRPIGRDVRVIIEAESPRRYFETAPMLRATVNGLEVSQLGPSTDFRWEFVVPGAALDAAAGQVTIESNQWFVPGDRDGTADRRHLALRVYSLWVE